MAPASAACAALPDSSTARINGYAVPLGWPPTPSVPGVERVNGCLFSLVVRKWLPSIALGVVMAVVTTGKDLVLIRVSVPPADEGRPWKRTSVSVDGVLWRLVVDRLGKDGAESVARSIAQDEGVSRDGRRLGLSRAVQRGLLLRVLFPGRDSQ